MLIHSHEAQGWAPSGLSARMLQTLPMHFFLGAQRTFSLEFIDVTKTFLMFVVG